MSEEAIAAWAASTPQPTTSGWDTPQIDEPLPAQAYEVPHAAMSWTTCTNDYCNTHRSEKEGAYYPQPRRRRQQRTVQRGCGCTTQHDPALVDAIITRQLNPKKACTDWKKGKRLCEDCNFLVCLEGHQERCGANANLAGEEQRQQCQPSQEQEEATALEEAVPALVDVRNATTLMEQTVNAQQATAVSLAAANQIINENRDRLAATLDRQDADHTRLQQMIRQCQDITEQQQRLNEQQWAQQHVALRARQRATRVQRPPRNPRPRNNRNDLVGASVWKRGLMSRTTRDMLRGAAIAAAGLWLAAVTSATVERFRKG